MPKAGRGGKRGLSEIGSPTISATSTMRITKQQRLALDRKYFHNSVDLDKSMNDIKSFKKDVEWRRKTASSAFRQEWKENMDFMNAQAKTYQKGEGDFAKRMALENIMDTTRRLRNEVDFAGTTKAFGKNISMSENKNVKRDMQTLEKAVKEYGDLVSEEWKKYN